MTCKPSLFALAAALFLAACGNGTSAPDGVARPGQPETVRRMTEANAAAAAGDLARAAGLLDAALAAEPDNPAVWVATARLRYRGGEHVEALAAADRALQLGPQYGGALLLKAQLVRDAHGLAASLPWYEAAVEAAPDDPEVLLDHAATLGDLGRNRAMLGALDRLREVAPQTPRANFLTAVLAARGGNVVLARSLLERSGMVAQGVPAALMLDALISLEQANYTTAAERLETVLQRQPGNVRVRELLARAMLLAGREAEVVARFGDDAALAETSPYLATLVGRAHERLGERDKAAMWLERGLTASAPNAPRVLAPAPGLPPPTAAARSLALAGNWSAVTASTAALRQRFSGSADVAALSGDGALGAGDAASALTFYASAAQVRRSWPLARKAIAAFRMAGDEAAADILLMRHLAGDPGNLDAALLLAERSLAQGDKQRAILLLDHVAALGGAHDLTYRALRARLGGG
ncbi:MAG: tetratricopeptide repeat protein [Porphyrobacter sp.]|nr:tetratricopeptide repeat protein [Porphyrobacter sp.]